MAKNNILLFGGIVVAIFFIMNQPITTQTETILDKDTLRECNDRRNDLMSEAACVGTCQQITSAHTSCRGVDNDEVGEFGFFRDFSTACDQLSGADLEQWICFYGTDPTGTSCDSLKQEAITALTSWITDPSQTNRAAFTLRATNWVQQC